MQYFIIFLSLCCSWLYASNDEEFYLLPMGQGNGQLIIYHDESGDIGVLYDLGSTSLQMHPKFTARGNWDPTFSILNSKIDQKIDVELEDNTFDSPPRKAFVKHSTPITTNANHSTPITTNAKLTVPQRELLGKKLESFICERLMPLQHLFIFLSHSDKDHINFINPESIPDTVPITVFLSGDWFGDIGVTKKNDINCTSAVIDVLSFLKDRLDNNKSTQFYFPYYDDFKIKENDESHDFNRFLKKQFISSLKEELLRQKVNEFSRHCLRTNLNTPNPPFFTGTLEDLYRRAFSDEIQELLDSNLAMIDVLRNVYIWSLNQLSDDINNHSIILSCTLPRLNMSVICTGDANHSVFQRIAAEYKNKNFREVLNQDKRHFVIPVLPHHSSRHNSSGSLLNFFTPDAFAVPAGDGGQHGHPSLSLIQSIKEVYGRGDLTSNFYDKYSFVRPLDFIAIEKEGETKKNILVKVRNNQNEPPFFCPNIYGCIKWDNSGIHTNFENSLTIEEISYVILYSSHIWELDKPLKKFLINAQLTLKATDGDSREELVKVIAIAPKSSITQYLCVVESMNHTNRFVGILVDEKIYFYAMIDINS